MSFYQDGQLKITKNKIYVKGVLIPKISNIIFDPEEIKEIKEINLGWKERLNFGGTTDLKTWWAIDFFKPFRKKAFLIVSSDPVGRFDTLGVSARNFEAAKQVFKDNYPHLMH